jgi:hypothetical protein
MQGQSCSIPLFPQILTIRKARSATSTPRSAPAAMCRSPGTGPRKTLPDMQMTGGSAQVEGKFSPLLKPPNYIGVDSPTIVSDRNSASRSRQIARNASLKRKAVEEGGPLRGRKESQSRRIGRTPVTAKEKIFTRLFQKCPAVLTIEMFGRLPGRRSVETSVRYTIPLVTEAERQIPYPPSLQLIPGRCCKSPHSCFKNSITASWSASLSLRQRLMTLRASPRFCCEVVVS